MRVLRALLSELRKTTLVKPEIISDLLRSQGIKGLPIFYSLRKVVGDLQR